MTIVDDMLAVIGSDVGTVPALYWQPQNLVQSAGNLVTWDDYRGAASFGPQLLPNGGSGGTAPTVDANYVITAAGSSSYVRHSNATGALAAFPISTSSARSLVFWGELVDTANTYWPLAVDSDAGGNLALIKRQATGAKAQINLFPDSTTPVAPKLLPPSGVRTLFILSMPAHYGFASADPGGSGAVWMLGPWGRAPLMEAQGAYSATTGFISLGRYATAFGSMKIRGFMWVNRALTYQDVAAIEKMAALDGCDLYNQPDSAGLMLCIGDSLTHGYQSTSPSTNTPVDVTGTGFPSHVQRLYNNMNSRLRMDVLNRGTISINGIEACQPASGHATSYIQDMAAFSSPARAAAGFFQCATLWYGANDLGSSSAADLIKATSKAVYDLQIAGFKVALFTVIPLTAWFGAPNETKRLRYNDMVRANVARADVAIDLSQVNDAGTFFVADPVGTDTITTNTTYYNADGIHLQNIGYQRIGEYVFAQMSAAGCFDPPRRGFAASALRPRSMSLTQR